MPSSARHAAARRASAFGNRQRLELWYLSGHENEPQEIGEGATYTFTMPARNVELEAIFTAGGSSEPNTITVESTTNGTVAVTQTIDGAPVTITEAVAGTPVTITTTPTDGYSIDACLVYAKETIGGAIYWTLLDVERTDFTHYTFAMPASPVRVEVTYRQTLLGDVNNDGRVDVTDYIGVANHILGSTPKVFHRDAADVNRDSQIDVSDYIGVANIILGGNGGSGAGGTEPGTGDVPATAD